MQTSIIGGIREYLNGCPLLSEIPVKKRHINRTDADSENYGILTDGNIPVKKFIDGSGKYCYAFTLCVNKMSAEDEQALKSAEFIERLQDWCSAASAAKNLPELPEGCTATKLEAVDGMLAEIPKNQKYGKYLIQFKLFYTRRI